MKQIPNNEIWYFTDRSKLSPNTLDGFGAKFVNHEYKNGKGIITFDEPVTAIPNDAFSRCLQNNNVYLNDETGYFILPNSVTSIGDYAFDSCTGISKIIIPNGIEHIGKFAFSGCEYAETVIIPKSVTSISENPFSHCVNLKKIIVEKDNPVYDSRDNCNAIIETSTNKLIVGCQSTIIPNNVTSIDKCAFAGCTKMKSIVVPENITNIKEYAFAGCESLENIKFISEYPPSIDSHVFVDCFSLKNIMVPVDSIEEYEEYDEFFELDYEIINNCFKIKNK